jgi:hypothetical protein
LAVDAAVAAAFLTCAEVVCVDVFELSVDVCPDGNVGSLTPAMVREALVDSDSRIADLISEMESGKGAQSPRTPPSTAAAVASPPAPKPTTSIERASAESPLSPPMPAAAAAAAAAPAIAAQATAAAATVAAATAALAEELSELGFPRAWCLKALAARRGENVEAALAYILENELSLDDAADEPAAIQVPGASDEADAAATPEAAAVESGEHPWHVPGHVLELCDRLSGWSCDGRRAPGGCRGTGGGDGPRHRCRDPGCDYDLCGLCWSAAAENTSFAEAATDPAAPEAAAAAKSEWERAKVS